MISEDDKISAEFLAEYYKLCVKYERTLMSRAEFCDDSPKGIIIQTCGNTLDSISEHVRTIMQLEGWVQGWF